MQKDEQGFIPLQTVINMVKLKIYYKRIECIRIVRHCFRYEAGHKLSGVIMIIDTHTHYDDRAYDDDREEVLSSLSTAGIEYVVNVGASLASTASTVRLTEKYPYIYGAVGVHPDKVDELDEEKLKWLESLTSLPKIVAVGEIGLDYYWDKSDRNVQKKWFAVQMDLAKRVNLPIIVHSRDAAMDTLDIMKAEHANELRGVIHCFSYSAEIAREYLNWGYFLGIGGVITFKNARKVKEVVEYMPLSQLLLETDCPYLAPAPYRGKRNTSANIPLIIKEIADIKGMSSEEVEQIAYENAKRFYGFA